MKVSLPLHVPNLNIPYIQSTVSTYALEEVAQAAPSATKWFQLYWSTNEEIAFSMAARAEAAGFEAIVLTVDTVMLGWREEDVRNQFSPLKLGYARGNYMNDPVLLPLYLMIHLSPMYRVSCKMSSTQHLIGRMFEN